MFMLQVKVIAMTKTEFEVIPGCQRLIFGKKEREFQSSNQK